MQTCVLKELYVRYKKFKKSLKNFPISAKFFRLQSEISLLLQLKIILKINLWLLKEEESLNSFFFVYKQTPKQWMNERKTMITKKSVKNARYPACFCRWNKIAITWEKWDNSVVMVLCFSPIVVITVVLKNKLKKHEYYLFTKIKCDFAPVCISPHEFVISGQI